MILYQVYKGIITIKSVKKETPSGWREHNNGFQNRSEMSGTLAPCLSTRYYTANIDEAKSWQARCIDHMEDVIQVSYASLSDIEFWSEHQDSNEDCIPKSRVFYK